MIDFWEGLEEVSTEIVSQDIQKKDDRVGDNRTITIGFNRFKTILEMKSTDLQWQP